jgi:hypothetical protein
MSRVDRGMAGAMPWNGIASRKLRALGVALVAATIALAGCGGGGVEVQGDGFSIGVAIDGQTYGAPVASGTHQDVSIWAGQSVAFDASEAVVWTLYAGNAAIPANGSTVYYGGATIRATAVSSSRIVVDTDAAGPLSQAVPVTLTATSTWDSALVATVNLYIF